MRSDLPTGTVTLLFTDVEGSTKLLRELGADAYADALADHRRIVRETCTAEGGVEVDTQGDAFFLAFPSAPRATAAAQAITAALAPGPISLRIGLHTGTPLVTDEGYVGDDVHFAARVAAAGHGGQILLSRSARELLDGPSVSDLGEHRLKDIEGAVSIYQLGDKTFPPLKTISNTNLPRPASSFIGREVELAEVLARLEDGARVVTLTGPGGTGKTRLALEAAISLVGDYKAGVFWVGLAALRDSALVTETIAQVLGARDDLSSNIGERELCLLLDNLEQVIDAAPALSSVLQNCPNLTLLITSRELLRISGEVEYAVPPLASAEAVSLFCERAQVEPADEISELCARLDSLPLAVELAAARTSALTPARILERLSSRLDLLKGGRDADPRQQTLRATIEWSYELLSPDERALFSHLAVFAGGCTLEAAEEVADADLDTLQSLIEKSLLRFTPSESGGRYWMLETIREYASEELVETRTGDALRRRHAEWMVAVVERDAGAAAAELDNLRAALGWTVNTGRGELGLRLANATRRYWANAGHVREGLEWLLDAAERGPEDMLEQRAMVMATATFCAMRVGDIALAREIAEAQLEVSRDLGGSSLAAGLGGLATVLEQMGDVEGSRELFEQAIELARAEGSPSVVAASLFNSAAPEFALGNYERALQLYIEALDAFRACDDAQGEAHALVALGDCCIQLDRMDEGVEYARHGLLRLHALGLPRLFAEALLLFADVARLEAEWNRAATLLGAHSAVLQSAVEVREPRGEAVYNRIDAECRSALGDARLGEVFTLGAAMTWDEAVGYALRPTAVSAHHRQNHP